MSMDRIWSALDGVKPLMVMVVVQTALAAVNVFYKLAADDGMNLKILVAYRYLFAAAFMIPLAFFVERRSRPKLTWTIVGQGFLCGLFGGSMCQNFLLESLALTSATFATAMGNLVPGVTFILAVCFRLEKLAIKTASGKAKVVGTLIGIAGAMLLTFYNGVKIKSGSTKFHLLKHNHDIQATHTTHDQVLGALLSVGGCVSFAAWLIVQAKLSKRYPCHYSSTAMMTIMASIQSVLFALCIERNWKEWRMGWDIRLLTAAFSGIVGSGFMVILISWCVYMRGPLYVSVFNPLMLILVAIAGFLILNENLYLGSVLGGILIVVGLYGVLWGKGQEMKKKNKLMPTTGREDTDEVIEITTSSTIDEQNKVNEGNMMKKPSSVEEGEIVANVDQ